MGHGSSVAYAGSGAPRANRIVPRQISMHSGRLDASGGIEETAGRPPSMHTLFENLGWMFNSEGLSFCRVTGGTGWYGGYSNAMGIDRVTSRRMADKELRRADRRAVDYDSIVQAVQDAERLAAAEVSGTLTATGNWTLGRTLSHIAWWANEAFEGHRFPLYLCLFFKLVGPVAKRKALRGSVRSGVRLPGVKGGTYGTSDVSTDEGLEQMRSAFFRLERECPMRPDAAFGKLTHDEWKTLHLNHARHHLSYFGPSG